MARFCLLKKLKLWALFLGYLLLLPVLAQSAVTPVTGSISTDFTFIEGETYSVTGPVTLTGATTFEGGAIIKFDSNGSLNVSNSSFKSTFSDRILFTSKDDDSIGEVITGSTGSPASYPNALTLTHGTVRFVEIRYADEGIAFAGNGTLTVRDSEFFAVGTPINASSSAGPATVNLNNLLIANGANGPVLADDGTNALTVNANNITLTNLTGDGFSNNATAAGSSLSVTDCLFVNIQGTSVFSGTAPTTENYNAFFQTPQNGNGANDVVLATDPLLTDFFLDQASTVINAGSRSATDAGMYHYNTNADGTLEGPTQIDIGYHASPSISQFSILALKSIWMKSGSMVSGDISVNQATSGPFLDSDVALVVGHDMNLPTAINLRADSIKVKTGAVVNGKVYHNQLENNGTINGATLTPLVFPILDELPLFRAATLGTVSDINVAAGTTHVLAPGDYGVITVNDNATLQFTGGLYQIQKIDAKKTTSLLFDAPSEVRIKENLVTKRFSTLVPSAGTTLTAGDIRFYVEGADTGTQLAIDFGHTHIVKGHFYAPNGTLSLKRQSTFSGIFLAKDVMIGHDSEVELDDGGTLETVATPAITPNGGTFTGSVDVSLSTITSGAIIHFTTDGSTPTATSPVFTGPITLTGSATTQTVKAIAVRSGFNDSSVTSVDFIVNNPPVAAFTALPTTGQIPLTVSFDASTSTDPENNIATYTWDFGDTNAGTGVTTTHQYTSGGTFTVTLTVTDAIGLTSQATADIRVNLPPTLEINSPADGGFVIQKRPEISLSYSDDVAVDTASLALTANGTSLSVDCQLNSTFATCTPTEDLPEGNITLAATVSDFEAQTGTDSNAFFVDTIPVEVAIISPVDQFITTEDQIIVTGAVGTTATSVEVNGVPATITGANFSATVPLREGKNMLVAIGRNNNNKPGVSSVDITRDIQKPIVRIDSPRDGFPAVENRVTVTGVVNDIVDGGIAPTVRINGIEVPVVNNTFIGVDLELGLGPNTIEAVATDSVGNTGNHSITVNFKPPAGPKLVLVSGNGQKAQVGTPLTEPLMVKVLDGEGLPVAGRTVRFEVTRNNGTLSGQGMAFSNRIIGVITDGNGEAKVNLTLGNTAGGGNNRVKVTSPSVAGEIEFCATGLPNPPDKIINSMGNNQRGPIGEPLPIPLEALAVGPEGNPAAGLEVTFNVVEGSGSFNSQNSITVVTGSDGIARAIFTLGFEPGTNNNVATASFVDNPGLVATFTASGLATGDPANTTFSGLVLDNAQTPIPGTTVSIDGTTVSGITDTNGHFLLTGVPVGNIVLHIDPSTSSRTENFPPLEFETVTIAGVENILGQSIFIPEVDLINAQIVGGAQDVVLTMNNMPGAELKVFANSVTFPDGSNTGLVSISQVQFDKIPMPPPGGFIPPIAWTIQPAGVVFDPPAEIQMPNTDGLAPGTLVNIEQFDHDVFTFVRVAQGQVTEDGQFVVSDPGFGITRAGWGDFGRAQPLPNCNQGSSAGTPPVCFTFNSEECRWDKAPDGSSCDDGNECTLPGECNDGKCEPGQLDPEKEDVECEDEVECIFMGECSVDGKCKGGTEYSIDSLMISESPVKPLYSLSEDVRFTSNLGTVECGSVSDFIRYSWDFGDGGFSFDENPIHSFQRGGALDVALSVTCGQCKKVLQKEFITINVESISVKIKAKFVDQDDPRNSKFVSLSESSILFGGSSPKTSDNLKLTAQIENPDELEISNIIWSIEGTGSGSYSAPTPSSEAVEWNVGEIQKGPASLTFKVAVHLENGEVVEDTLENVEVGIRADDVLALAWINENQVPPLDTEGIHESVIEYFPPNGFGNILGEQNLITAAYLGQVGLNITSRPGGILNGFLTQVEKTYILNWLFKGGANPTPPASFAAKANIENFRENKIYNYKLFNRIQMKYVLNTSGQAEQITLIEEKAKLGKSRDPVLFGIAGLSEVEGENHGDTETADPSSIRSEGSPNSLTVDVFNVLASPGVWSHIGVTIMQGTSFGGGTGKSVDTTNFPTFNIYDNGALIDQQNSTNEPLVHF